MKRIMTALALTAVMCVPKSYAQEFGVTGGINVATIGGGRFSNKTVNDGVVVGGFARLKLIGGLSFQPEILFSTKGGGGFPEAGINPIWDASYVISRREILDYLEVPLLLRLNAFSLPGSPLSFDLIAGPDVAFLAYGINKVTFFEPPGPQVQTTGGPGGLNLFDLNVVLGGGPEFNLGSTALGIQLRYTFGTGRIFPNAGDGWANDVWSIMASASL